jgi:hypothetical protein
VLSIFRFILVIPDVSYMFFESGFKFSTSLAYVYLITTDAFPLINSTIVIFVTWFVSFTFGFYVVINVVCYIYSRIFKYFGESSVFIAKECKFCPNFVFIFLFLLGMCLWHS